jgi:stage V sporulation protein G
MEITEVRVRLLKNQGDQLKAFCSVTVDNEFVIRDIKVIQGEHGCFIAMPSRKMDDRCARCGGKNYVGAKFCNGCGGPLPQNRVKKDASGRPRLHAEIVHPISAECRKRIQDALLSAYEGELERSKGPGCRAGEDELDNGALRETR